MAMGGFTNEELQAPMAEINTTPLVDVMLVLLVIFLVTAPMMTHAIKLELPSETTTQAQDKEAITVSVNANGEFFWNDEALSQQALEDRFKSAAGQDATQPIHLRADTNVAYGKVSHVLAAAQRYGLKNIGFLTTPE